MQEILFDYKSINPTSWAYLSSLLMIGLYFKFGRLWSLRNLDLICVILLAPGMLLVKYSEWLLSHGSPSEAPFFEKLGYIWLFSIGAVFLLRLLLDSIMVRRPLLEPNMTIGGMTFIGLALFIFLMANVMTSKLKPDDLLGVQGAQNIQEDFNVRKESFQRYGPGYPLIFLVSRIPTQTLFNNQAPPPSSEPKEEQTVKASKETQEEQFINARTVRIMAILANFAVVAGIVFVGFRHFDNYKTGVAAATLYLLLPYTAITTGSIHHILPAALLIWVIASYRRPMLCGMLMGLAIGSVYYPVFLLPLWMSFYWRRGLFRFIGGVMISLAIMVSILAILALNADSLDLFVQSLRQMFGLKLPTDAVLFGLWKYVSSPIYRLPVIAAFVALIGSFAIWPAQKNLGTLISCSAVVMLGTQFWHAYQGGLYMAWYLPLLLLAIFRPNLEDRVALSVLGEGRLPKWKKNVTAVNQAA